MTKQEAFIYIQTTPRQSRDTMKMIQYESAFSRDKGFALEYAKHCPERYDYLDRSLKDDKEVMKAHITGDMGTFFVIANPMQAASNRLRSDKAFIVDCMESKPKNIIPIFEGMDKSLKEVVLNHPNVIQKTEALPILKACIELEKRGIEYKAGDDILNRWQTTDRMETMQSQLKPKAPSQTRAMKI